jgi:F-type H+-transporting ATPase subunit b
MATEATEAGSHGGEAVGMPQLDFSTWPNQIFWLLVTLAVIYFLLTRIPGSGRCLPTARGPSPVTSRRRKS